MGWASRSVSYTSTAGRHPLTSLNLLWGSCRLWKAVVLGTWAGKKLCTARAGFTRDLPLCLLPPSNWLHGERHQDHDGAGSQLPSVTGELPSFLWLKFLGPEWQYNVIPHPVKCSTYTRPLLVRQSPFCGPGGMCPCHFLQFKRSLVYRRLDKLAVKHLLFIFIVVKRQKWVKRVK